MWKLNIIILTVTIQIDPLHKEKIIKRTTYNARTSIPERPSDCTSSASASRIFTNYHSRANGRTTATPEPRAHLRMNRRRRPQPLPVHRIRRVVRPQGRRVKGAVRRSAQRTGQARFRVRMVPRRRQRAERGVRVARRPEQRVQESGGRRRGRRGRLRTAGVGAEVLEELLGGDEALAAVGLAGYPVADVRAAQLGVRQGGRGYRTCSKNSSSKSVLWDTARGSPAEYTLEPI